MILIERIASGERECVHDASDKDPAEWRVLEEGVTRPRGHCVREGGRWRIDRAAHGARRIEVDAAAWAALHERLAELEAKG